MDSPTDTFLTLAAPSQSIYKEKGSKFIGLAFPVTSEDEIKNILANLRKQYYDARHHCYAYMLGATGDQYRANDDGEPNHSAGDPILGQIRSAGLTNILVVVVRYFGGTKLGVGGLIQAYKTTAAEAIKAAPVTKAVETVLLHLQFDYAHLNTIMSLIKEYKLEIAAQELNTHCQISLQVRKSLVSAVQAKLTTLALVKIG